MNNQNIEHIYCLLSLLLNRQLVNNVSLSVMQNHKQQKEVVSKSEYESLCRYIDEITVELKQELRVTKMEINLSNNLSDLIQYKTKKIVEGVIETWKRGCQVFTEFTKLDKFFSRPQETIGILIKTSNTKFGVCFINLCALFSLEEMG